MRVPICTGNFTTPSAGAAPDGAPAHFEWQHVGRNDYARFYTDWCLPYALGKPGPKAAWLIEAKPFRQEWYDFVKAHVREFDWVVSYDLEFLREVDDLGTDIPTLWYPLGGCRIPLKDWGLHSKPSLLAVSMLASNKTDATGHKLRHEVYKRFGDRLDIWGSIRDGVTLADKTLALVPYHYSVVIEGESNAGCFSDHLIDCLAVGTVPIHWGAVNIGDYFHPEGIIQFRNVEDLAAILDRLSLRDYKSRLPAVMDNLAIAKKYRVPEDWIWEHYRFLFEGLD